ncbi:hypothetical protein ACFFOS_13210 [Nocardioides kongjuensis]|uniref:Uncharacterized protein n=1 Tax=Nocardioides kongjuensis TaxID=349522 RepID=A0A852RCG4_9ACTN|nr:hypothetical protein [Nocardioides kongjuensis]NYD32683.1 hypothetical protein [Nocardioides kongjuensis]
MPRRTDDRILIAPPRDARRFDLWRDATSWKVVGGQLRPDKRGDAIGPAIRSAITNAVVSTVGNLRIEVANFALALECGSIVAYMLETAECSGLPAVTWNIEGIVLHACNPLDAQLLRLIIVLSGPNEWH